MAEPDGQRLSELEAPYKNPCKDFMRERWLEAARCRRDRNAVDCINYLTFPGPGCADVELFKAEGLVKTKGEVYEPESLTFCEKRPLVWSQVRRRLTNAKDVKLPYEELVGAGQVHYHPWLSDKKLFPYDVINLDFMEPPFRLGQRQESRQIQAIVKTFQLQKFHGRSFTLLVTFPAEADFDDDPGKAAIDRTITSNLKEGPKAFSKRYRQRYGEARPDIHHEAYLIAVPKLILRAGFNENFDVACNGRFTYVGHQTRMVSFVFDCEYAGVSVYEGGPTPGALERRYEEELIRLLQEQFIDVNERLAEGNLAGPGCVILEAA